MNKTYDIIGDIHGYARPLEKLLNKLGYFLSGGYYRHPEPNRRAIFLGDFIDRGPQNFRVLDIVKAMVDNGTALAVLGNHEFNALCFHTPKNKKDGMVNEPSYLRPHIAKNIKQHEATLKEIDLKHDKWLYYLDWFKTMPLYLDLPGLRIIHACWDGEKIAWLRTQAICDREGRLTTEFLHRASDISDEMYFTIETLLKGKEINLPEGECFYDKDGYKRIMVRVKWWLSGEGVKNFCTFADITFAGEETLKKLKYIPLNQKDLGTFNPNDKSDHSVPTFIGHYWLDGDDEPKPLAVHIACLDYSIAKGGKLVAYTWRGEQNLVSSGCTYVSN